MMRCDLCGTIARCVQKEIEGREFDLCEACWQPLAEKLSGKGRASDAHHDPEIHTELEEYEEVVF